MQDVPKLYGVGMADTEDPRDPVRIGFGLRLKSAREAKGMTQLQVADLFGISKATVSAWEKGAGMPDAMRLRRLARLYDVSADALLWDDSLTPEAMRFAAQFDALTEQQRRTFKVMWMAYFEDALSDEGVEHQMPITKDRRSAIEHRDGPVAALDHPHRRKSDHR